MSALKTSKTKQNGLRGSLGNPPNAVGIFADTPRKPEKAAPFHERLELAGHLVFLEHSPAGIVALSPFGELQNPWTNLPFQSRKDCLKAVRYRLAKGWWPGLKPKKERP